MTTHTGAVAPTVDIGLLIRSLDPISWTQHPLSRDEVIGLSSAPTRLRGCRIGSEVRLIDEQVVAL